MVGHIASREEKVSLGSGLVSCGEMTARERDMWVEEGYEEYPVNYTAS